MFDCDDVAHFVEKHYLCAVDKMFFPFKNLRQKSKIE